MQTMGLSLLDMSNSTSTTARREEEIAFLLMENVLGVNILLLDAGTGDRKPDGTWNYPDDAGRRGVVEVTSPPDKKLMRDWAIAKRNGDVQSESGSVPVRANQLAEVIAELLREKWSEENIVKLLGEVSDEHHLFLFARSQRVGGYFERLSDALDPKFPESVDDLVLPPGLSDLWVLGRAYRDRDPESFEATVARYRAGSGWHRYTARISESQLPAPNAGVSEDSASVERRPKNRANRSTA